MTETVLLALDSEARAETVIERGLNLAADRDAEVYGLFVVGTGRYGGPALSSTEIAVDEVEDERNERLRALRERATDRGIDVSTDRCRGHPDEEAVAWAEKLDADVVVLDERRRRHRLVDALDRVCDRVVFASQRTAP